MQARIWWSTKEFHNSFDFPPETVPPGTSHGNPSSQSSTPLAPNRGAHGSQDEIAELSPAVAQAKAENVELECQTKVAKLKAELHALHKRNALLQSQTARVEAVPAEYARVREPSVTIKDLRADPVLTAKVSVEIDHLGLSSSDSDDEGGVSTKKSSLGKKLKSGKTAKLTSRVVTPQLWPHSFLSLAYVSKDMMS